MSEVIRIAARGDGVTSDGRHIALTAPGDRVGEDGTIVHGPHHQTPPCRHFPACGGCQLQQLDDASWAQFLIDRCSDALHAQGLATTIRPPHLSPPRSRRRATLHADAGGRIGFTAAKSHDIIDMRECHVLSPELFALIAPLRVVLPRLGAKRRFDVHLTLVDQGVDVLVKGFVPVGLAAAEAASDFARNRGLARLAFDDGMGPETRWMPDEPTVTLSGVTVPMPIDSFLQATREGEAALIAAVHHIVGSARTVADLFAGLGTFALSLDTRVYAAEGARDATLALKAATGRIQRPVFVDHRDLYRRPLTVDELNRFDAIVLDPPRAGARDQADALAACMVPTIAYVSCNPSSFARDAKTLCEGGYALDWVQPVGQFRWSTHVELVGCFTRQDSPRR